MSDTTASLRRKITSAGELQSVVRTMKAMAASSIGQYEEAVRALADYALTVEQGLGACLRDPAFAAQGDRPQVPPETGLAGAVVFGSDQGLVGRFNDVVADRAIETLAALSGPPVVWAVGERVYVHLVDAGLSPVARFAVPGSVEGIAALVGEILVATETAQGGDRVTGLHLVYNRPAAGALYAPVSQRLLPLDEAWRHALAARPWPTPRVPEVIGGSSATVRAFIREYLYVSLFRACAESLASENASRLAAMQRADRNIDELLLEFKGRFHRVRQTAIDEELFDVVAGFEVLGR